MQRNWAQFHSLRNLIVSLNLEASELLELTQWKSDAEMADLAGSSRRPGSAARRMRRRADLPAADCRAGRHRPRRRRTASWPRTPRNIRSTPATDRAGNTRTGTPAGRRRTPETRLKPGPQPSRHRGRRRQASWLSSVNPAPSSRPSTLDQTGHHFLQSRLQGPRWIDHEQAAAVHPEAVGWPAS
jgi:hypothetical protein